jgi:hypothetical protein
MEKQKPLPQESNAHIYKRFAEATKPTTGKPKKEGQQPAAKRNKDKT